MLASVNVLLEFLAADYRSTIKTIERLTAQGEITFELLYATLVPRTLIVARCAVTGLERLFQLQPLPGQAFGDGALVHSQANAMTENADLSPEDLLLTPTVVYGFSLSDKLWLEFDVTKVAPVAWNADAFANLVLPADRKTLLRSLVEAHHEEAGFDDFVKGKGTVLVVNLFGPPGVGKTFSAEATSEHVKRPLYVIGGGDLGTRAADLDMALERVFDVATCWKAIVLIDEADVFLERRSLHDLERNAMVAIFLRHVEYYRGILFLTTNRVQAFDEAFLSRIHVALHFAELSEASRAQVWRAFIGRAGVQGVDDAQIAQLARRDVNGRQIKNAVRTAHSLALGRKEQVGLRHFLETLDAMDEFTEQFEGMKAAADQ
ncbi:P-loop containing nucleoside triphosphate hydrolase protein [Mycena epipterygia]|nr:P-loop containing nucleoside triphosphate hydrolase protein [Mycena epipterygia]